MSDVKVPLFLNRPGQLEKPFTYNSGEVVALRIYPDNQPKNLEIAALQKGLVLVVNGSELVEEGAGFGVPIAKYSDATLFSRNAKLFVEEQTENFALITKVFFLDSVSKKRVNGVFINNKIYSAFHKTFERAYLNRGNMRSIFDWIMRLRKSFGVETHFINVSPRGKVTVRYHCYPDYIKVSADFSDVDVTDCQEILILNEQGANFFRKFRNGSSVLQDKKIGAWTRVDAEVAEFSDLEDHISFSIGKRESAIMCCGWEQVKDRFSWAGMTFSLSPNTLVFDYTIQLKNSVIGNHGVSLPNH
jgi:hypothetical protein